MTGKKRPNKEGVKEEKSSMAGKLKASDLKTGRDARAVGFDEDKQLLTEKVESLTQQIEKHQLAIAQKDQDLKRSMADYQNLLERSQREVSQAQIYGLQSFAKEMLPMLDSFEQALSTCQNKQAHPDTIYEGLDLTFSTMLKALAKFSIEIIEPAVGEVFNPDWHEAISAQEDEKAEPNTVLQVIQKGYKIKDRLLRPALVVVVKDS